MPAVNESGPSAVRQEVLERIAAAARRVAAARSGPLTGLHRALVALSPLLAALDAPPPVGPACWIDDGEYGGRAAPPDVGPDRRSAIPIRGPRRTPPAALDAREPVLVAILAELRRIHATLAVLGRAGVPPSA